jgi:hypothetical protein
MDSSRYYDPPYSPSSSSDSDISDAPPPLSLTNNSSHKLEYSARFIRKGKVYAWGPAYEDGKHEKRSRKRLKRTLEAVFPDAAGDLGIAPPQNIVEAEAKREAKRIQKEEDAVFRLPHLRSPSPPASSAKIAPSLAIPQTYTDVMMNNAMRHTLANDTIDRGLMQTSNELLDSEKGLMQALGRLREVLRLRERDVLSKEHAGKDEGQTNGVKSEVEDAAPEPSKVPAKSAILENTATTRDGFIPSLPRIADTDNLWRVTQELIQSTYPTPHIVYTITEEGTAAPPSAPLVAPTQAQVQSLPIQPEPEVPKVKVTPVQRLFTHPAGLTVSAEHNPSHAGLEFPRDHPNYPVTTRYNVDMPAQIRAVDDALERIMELLVDCNEYKERLEETRDRVFDISRVRKRVWAAVKERTRTELENQ